jgi:type II secretory pathway component PulC
VIPLRSLHVTNVVLGALLACISYRTLQTSWQPEKSKKAETAKKAEATAPAEKPKITSGRYAIIDQANIFKNKDIVATPPPEPTPVPTPPPPLPKMDLVLKGTTISRLRGNVKALIFNKKTGKTEYYGRNDVISDSDGTKIIEITRTSVTFDRQGQIETLDLYPVDLNPLKEGAASQKTGK